MKDAIFKTLIRNGMFDNAHIRLSLTRGKKVGFFSNEQITASHYENYLRTLYSVNSIVSMTFIFIVGYLWNEPCIQSLWLHIDR